MYKTERARTRELLFECVLPPYPYLASQSSIVVGKFEDFPEVGDPTSLYLDTDSRKIYCYIDGEYVLGKALGLVAEDDNQEVFQTSFFCYKKEDF